MATAVSSMNENDLKTRVQVMQDTITRLKEEVQRQQQMLNEQNEKFHRLIGAAEKVVVATGLTVEDEIWSMKKALENMEKE